MNRVLQPPCDDGTYSYTVIGYYCQATNERPFMTSTTVDDRPPGLPAQQWEMLRRSIFTEWRFLRTKCLHIMTLVLSCLLVFVPYMVFIKNNDSLNEQQQHSASFVTLFVFPLAVFLSFCLEGLVHVLATKDAIRQCAISEAATVYNVGFHQKGRIFFIVGILTFTRKGYQEPSSLILV